MKYNIIWNNLFLCKILQKIPIFNNFSLNNFYLIIFFTLSLQLHNILATSISRQISIIFICTLHVIFFKSFNFGILLPDCVKDGWKLYTYRLIWGLARATWNPQQYRTYVEVPFQCPRSPCLVLTLAEIKNR